MNPFDVREEPPERDWLKEMDEHIVKLTEGSGWIAADLANKLFETLAIHDPQLLEGWLILTGPDHLRRWISAHAAALRAQERKRAAAGNFAAHARDFESSRESDQMAGQRLMGMFAVLHVVNPNGVQKRASEMTGKDHKFVGDGYRVRGRRALMEAAFHHAIANRVGDQRTDAVYTVEEYENMYRSIAGNVREEEPASHPDEPAPPLILPDDDLQAVKSVFAAWDN